MNSPGISNDYDWWLFTILRTGSSLIACTLFLLLTCGKKTKADGESSQNQSTKTATNTQTRTGTEKRNKIESVKTAAKKGIAAADNPAYQTVNDLDKELSLRHADMVAAEPKVKKTKIAPVDPHYEVLENSLVDTGEETALPAKTGVTGNPMQTAKTLRDEETAIPAKTGATGNPTLQATAPRTKVTMAPGLQTAALPSVFAQQTQAAATKQPAAGQRVLQKTQIKEKTNQAAPVKKAVGNGSAFIKATKYPQSQYML